jgi:hypothetical protein
VLDLGESGGDLGEAAKDMAYLGSSLLTAPRYRFI